jgi:outer membrane protein OmpA-like peptidoglycan-associated protein
MRKIIWTLTAASFVVAATFGSVAHAEPASKKETIGVGAGGVIGAVAGGPVGLIIGAAIGAKIGETMHKKDEEIDELSASLAESETTVASLEYDVATLERNIDRTTARLEELQSASRPELVNLLEAGISMDLLFRTDEHVLANTTRDRLGELARAVAAMPDLRIRLDGFADERGDETYNQSLSEKRVDFVRDRLLAEGIDASRIVTRAHGETVAEDATPDSLALERRVSLTLFIADAPALASNPE